MTTAKTVVQLPLAAKDVEAAIDFYLFEASQSVALGFVDALEGAYRLIGEQPAAGSSRYAHELQLPGLRSWPLKRYPYLVFYIEHADRVDVWRVLHAASDLPAWMTEAT